MISNWLVCISADAKHECHPEMFPSVNGDSDDGGGQQEVEAVEREIATLQLGMEAKIEKSKLEEEVCEGVTLNGNYGFFGPKQDQI